MKYLLPLLFVLIGCDEKNGNEQRILSKWSHEEVCIKGVTYYKTVSSMAPKFTREGKIVLCSMIAN